MFVRIKTKDYEIQSLKVDIAQNEIGKVSFSMVGTDLDFQNYLDLINESYQVYHNGSVHISGIIFDTPTFNISKDNKVVVSISGTNELGTLVCYRSKTTAHYQAVNISNIVQDLLSTTTDWILGNSSTMVDLASLVTIDLRTKETLFAQLVEAVKSVPKCFLRYGGYNSILGKHMLDIGYFNADSGMLFQDSNLIEMRVEATVNRSYTVVESYGDKSASSRITLRDSLASPATTAHPDYPTYPIVVDPLSGTYVVMDLTAGKKGCAISKSFNVVKTRNDIPPTSAEIAEAGYSLWRKTVRFLQQNSQYVTLSTVGTYAQVPIVGDRLRVRGVVEETILNDFTLEEKRIKTLNIDGYYRVTKVSYELGTVESVEPNGDLAGQYVVSVDLTNNDYGEITDTEIELYSMVENFDAADNASVLSIKGSSVVSLTYGVGNPPDGTCSGVAKKYSFALPALPAGTTRIFYSISVPPSSGVTYSITQTPYVPAIPLELCVKVGGTWPGTGPITINVTYTFV